MITQKDKIIQRLISAGYLDRVEMHTQTLECRCMGDPKCNRCDRWGIWKTIHFLCFYFVVDGKEYSWHRPTNTVDIPFLSEDRGVDLSEITLPDDIPDDFDAKYVYERLYSLTTNGELCEKSTQANNTK
jgi:hypothetical protein